MTVVLWVVNSRRRRRQLPNTSADLSRFSRKHHSDTGEVGQPVEKGPQRAGDHPV
jgi:hypothetical protein